MGYGNLDRDAVSHKQRRLEIGFRMNDGEKEMRFADHKSKAVTDGLEQRFVSVMDKFELMAEE